MNPNRGDNVISPFGLDRDPISLVARAWRVSSETPTSWAQNEAQRLFDTYGHHRAEEPGVWFRGANTPPTFEVIVADLEAHGWQVNPWHPSVDGLVDLWTGANVFVRVTYRSLVQLEAVAVVELHCDQVAEFTADMERSGLWFYDGAVAV